MANTRVLLLIDDNPSHATVFQQAILNSGDGPFQGEWAKTLAEGIERIKQREAWAIFVNLSLPDSQGLATFDKVFSAAPNIPALVLAGSDYEDLALETLRRGAKDYLIEEHLDRYAFVRAMRNLAERKNSEEALLKEKERAQVTLNSIGDAVISTDIEGTITYVNVVAEFITGWLREEALGKSFSSVCKFSDSGTREPSLNSVKLVIEQNRTIVLAPNSILIRRDAQEFAIEGSAAPIHDMQGAVTGSVVVFHDVSKSRALGLEMSHLAQHDVLTNLPNRILLKDRLSQAIAMSRRNGTRVAVMYLDLDGFKQVNDSLGHPIGDKLLQLVSKRLLACVRNSDTVSRQGGDEFVVLLSQIAHACDAGEKASKILSTLLAPYGVDQYNLPITASIGISTYPDDGDDADNLIRNADLAMYQAKEKGRNNYQFFDKEMNVRAVKRQSIEGRLREAIEQNEFLLHYQPKINLKTGRITGVEALIRWMHPEQGLIRPLQFISIAEDSGLMVQIGRWVLQESCRQVQAWRDAGLRPIGIAVNVSSMEFRGDNFLEGVRSILQDTRLDPHYLELELTETVLMQQVEFTVPVLQKIRAMGVRLAIDDFGTGYSSLSYLRQFPIDTLKVDQSFVHEISNRTDDATIINAVINMGRSLKHRVIAEGLETAEQFAYLRNHGCDEGQGYYFSQPIPAAEVAKLLQTGIPSAAVHNGEGSWLVGGLKLS